jgi:hypothetical protein
MKKTTIYPQNRNNLLILLALLIHISQATAQQSLRISIGTGLYTPASTIETIQTAGIQPDYTIQPRIVDIACQIPVRPTVGIELLAGFGQARIRPQINITAPQPFFASTRVFRSTFRRGSWPFATLGTGFYVRKTIKGPVRWVLNGNVAAVFLGRARTLAGDIALPTTGTATMPLTLNFGGSHTESNPRSIVPMYRLSTGLAFALSDDLTLELSIGYIYSGTLIEGEWNRETPNQSDITLTKGTYKANFSQMIVAPSLIKRL